MKFKHSKKIKTAVLTALIAISFNTTTYAISQGTIDLSKEFKVTLEYHAPIGGNGAVSYLYYTPVDKTERYWDKIDYVEVTYKAGVLYYIEGTAYNSYDNPVQIQYDKITSLGNAQDIFGEGITEEEIKDLIANVEGDQTVDGNQTVTGSQDVQGGQTVSGALLIF